MRAQSITSEQPYIRPDDIDVTEQTEELWDPSPFSYHERSRDRDMPEMDERDGAYYSDWFAVVSPDLDANTGSDDDVVNVNGLLHPTYNADSLFETTTQ
jgi:hypothetical protein